MTGTSSVRPRIGIIGGSGLYQMPGFEAQLEISINTPWGSPSDAYIVGKLRGREVAFLARHGRGHCISPSELNFRANIYGLRTLGVERIISLSAVGSLKEEHRPLDFVIPDQFFDRTRGRISTFFGDGLVAHISFSDPICPQLADVVAAACTGAGVTTKKGGTYLCPTITGAVVANLRKTPPVERHTLLQTLTEREREILQMLAEGGATKGIAAKLFLSVKTVETHRAQLMEKLHVHNLADLTKFAVREGITSLE